MNIMAPEVLSENLCLLQWS